MAEKEQNDLTVSFLGLVASLASACWQHLGKIPNPMTQKIEPNINLAKSTIDILIMLREKTKGNLTADEERFLSNTIADLQLNYIDELKKKEEEKKEQT